MNNHEYLLAYQEWKDIVNTEDVDTPERFDAYLKDRANELTLEHAREEYASVMDSLNGAGPLDSAHARGLFISLGEILGVDVEWYRPVFKLGITTMQPVDDDG